MYCIILDSIGPKYPEILEKKDLVEPILEIWNKLPKKTPRTNL